MTQTIRNSTCVVLFVALAPAFAADGPSGTILREHFPDVAGTSIAELKEGEDFPDYPASRTQLNIFEIPADTGESYGTRVCGYIHPPATGEYTFWIASDDGSQLWLSASDDPAKKEKIAQVSAWSPPRAYDTSPEQKSKPITLSAGKKYYIEALHKEGGGGDNLAVGWQIPGGAKEQPIPGNRLAPSTPPKIAPPQPLTVTIKVNTPPPNKPGYHSLTGVFTFKGKEFPFGFGLWLPESYFASNEKFPLITTMHNVVSEAGGVTGGTEITYEGMALLMLKDIGADNRHSGEWPPVKFNPRKDAKFIGLMPQCPKDRGFQAMPMSGVIVEQINWVEKNYRMDGERVYLTGFSYGGSCSWAVAQQFPERFAAIAPLSARIAPKAEQSPEILKNVGVWCGVGQNDGDFFGACNKMNEIYTAAKHPNFRFTVIKGGAHHCYQSIYGNPEFWKWLLAQKRKP